MSDLTNQIVSCFVNYNNIDIEIQRLKKQQDELKIMKDTIFENVDPALSQSVLDFATEIKRFIDSRHPAKMMNIKNIMFNPMLKPHLATFEKMVNKHNEAIEARNSAITEYVLTHSECVETIRTALHSYCPISPIVTCRNMRQMSDTHHFKINEQSFYSVVSTNGTWAKYSNFSYIGTYLKNNITIAIYDSSNNKLDLQINGIEKLLM